MKKFLYRLTCVFSTACVCFLLWMAFTWSVEPSELITGLVVAVIVALFSSRFFVHGKPLGIFNPIKLAYTFGFIVFSLFPALIKSNISMAKYCFGIKKTNPGIVRIKTKLKSEYGLSMLSNAITLTPGTITVDIAEAEGQNYLYIHSIDDSGARAPLAGDEIMGKSESYIGKIFG